MEDEIYSMNESGKAVWNLIDGTHPVSEIIQILHSEFDAPIEQIKMDVESLLEELVKRKMIIYIRD
jgi:hypothetical protein